MSDEDEDAHEHGYEPERETFSHDPIGHASVTGGMSVGDLADQYGHAGVGAANLNEAVDVAATMFGDDDVTVFFSLAGAMVPAGMRRIVSDLIRDGYIDVLVTTGANLTHDSIEAIGGKHHHGEVTPEGMSEREHDETLRDEGVDRIYNVYLPQEFFATFESHLREEVFPPLEAECEGSEASRASESSSGANREKGSVSIQRLTEELGRANAAVNERDDVDEDPGIAAAAYESDVPIYCPAVQDSVLGLQAWMYSQTTSFTLDALSDMTDITDVAFDADGAGAFVVGGGVPKNYTLQTMLVTPRAYDYAVQLTMDPKQSGGLSGATLEEARSWGKLERDAENASVYGDATVSLPLVVAAARERVEGDGS
ncbi:deoxyhypusine synthase [Natrarchaeobaculum aegyptiacum]|uniref:Deoxyhypusine synthase n=1 Tax=Natrarchaeobaculum aegyptiacum TaxID=745377 RepID=A0A2Z2HT93_9EURY|nr:deoxyhypusine synthase [Natrarchaeobaculum aegyptiacum]ARS90409.1 deoxyhypusine synthase [Natrarchaeobaculum aegyptiacum]